MVCLSVHCVGHRHEPCKNGWSDSRCHLQSTRVSPSNHMCVIFLHFYCVCACACYFCLYWRINIFILDGTFRNSQKEAILWMILVFYCVLPFRLASHCVSHLNSPLWKMAPLLAVLLTMASSSSKLQNKLKRTLTQTHRGVSGHPAQMISACQSPADPTPSYFYTHITQDKIHINKINNLNWPMSHLLSATDDMPGHHTTPTLLRLLCYPPAAQEYTRFIWYNCTWLDAVS